MQKEQTKRKRILRTTINVLFFGLLLLVVLSPDAKSWVLRQLISAGLFKAKIQKNEKDTATPAASFAFADETGKTASTEELKGKVVFINFWASWCPPCRAEMPSLNKLYQKFKDDPAIVFLFINEDDDLQKGKSFLRKKEYPFPIHTAAGATPQSVFSGSLPTTVVLDKNGKIAMKHEGIANYNSDNFIEQLKELVNK